MIVDVCAAVAYFKNESTADLIEAALASSETLLMSSVTLAECCLVLSRAGAMTPAEARIEIEAARIEIVPVDAAQAVIAAAARKKYPIRFGDAFVYALAKARDLPVLTLDAEFAKTDVSLVVLGLKESPSSSYTGFMVTLDAALEADLRKVMVGRGLANEEEALRTVVQEAAQAVEASERARRQKALEEASGSWTGRGPDLPRKDDGSVDWGAWKDDLYRGMP